MLAANGGWIIGDVCTGAPLASESNYARHIKQSHFGIIGRADLNIEKWIRSEYVFPVQGPLLIPKPETRPDSRVRKGNPKLVVAGARSKAPELRQRG